MRPSPQNQRGSNATSKLAYWLVVSILSVPMNGPAQDKNLPVPSPSQKAVQQNPGNSKSTPKVDTPKAGPERPPDESAQRAQLTLPPFGPMQPLPPRASASTASVSNLGIAPGFIGDFYNSISNNITAPGSVVTNPDPSKDPNWTPLAIKLNASAVSTADGITHPSYYRSLDLLTNPNTGTQAYALLGSNNFAYAPNMALYQTHTYSAANGTIYYQDGFSIYNAPTYDGSGQNFSKTFGGTPNEAQNIILLGSNRHVFTGSQHDFSVMDALSKTPPVQQEIRQLVGPGVDVPLLKVLSVNLEAHPPIVVTSTEPSPGSASLHYLQNSTDGLYTVPIYLATNAVNIGIVSPSAGANGVQKLVDNSSPLPRDRVFFNYNYFSNTSQIIDGRSVSVTRITPGFEKTFFGDRMSVEVRVPMATTIDNINLTGTTNTGEISLGNQTTYLKGLLYSDGQTAISTGLGIQLPTAPGVDMYTTIQRGEPSIDVLQIKNQAIHLLPFIGAVHTPTDRFYAQSVIQFDFDATGNPVSTAAIYPDFQYTNGQITGFTPASTGLRPTGSLNDTNFMYLSGNAGYWIYKVRNPYETGITGIAPTIELHYNQSLQRSDVVAGAYGNQSNPITNISNVNSVLGINAVLGHDKYLSAAYVAPMTSGQNKFFDGELRLMFNYYFGQARVNSRFANVPSQ